MQHIVRYYRYPDSGDRKAVRFAPDVYSSSLPEIGYGAFVQVSAEGKESKLYRIGSIPRMKQIPHPSKPGTAIMLHEVLLVYPEDWRENPGSYPVVGEGEKTI
jgi:hypothetical protein